MKRVVIALAAALPLVFAIPAFAGEGSQPAKEKSATFEQMKADHLKNLDDRINSLQQERTCVQAAKTQDDLRGCRAKHRLEMKGRRGAFREMMRPGGPGGPMPPEAK